MNVYTKSHLQKISFRTFNLFVLCDVVAFSDCAINSRPPEAFKSLVSKRYSFKLDGSFYSSQHRGDLLFIQRPSE